MPMTMNHGSVELLATACAVKRGLDRWMDLLIFKVGDLRKPVVREGEGWWSLAVLCTP